MMALKISSLSLYFSYCFLLEVGASIKYYNLPKCHVVNESLDCPVPCNNARWEVTLLMTDGKGTERLMPSISSHVPISGYNQTSSTIFHDGKDENGFDATLVTYQGSCCVTEVKISAVDKRGNKGLCDFSVRTSTTTVAHLTTISPTPSNSPKMTESHWITSLLLTLTALLP